ncbi:hypothetical protein CWC11_06025 [Pseudoalteromonas sp. S3178]|uniref:DGQHR domain-containing protein n=1 Tax=Pseudoalteromonas sp. S3178 TaxID=579532 RepID=UPI00110B9434|nr:DGQHR domain-containing protein [Pseudoalteromonas sp. S3178]TMP07589.1 hypothetical protein CWC11_06025 [Pseudoalteromonas sp. S3178]
MSNKVQVEKFFNAMLVQQPLADFLVFKAKAREILDICRPVRLQDGKELASYGDMEILVSKVTSGTQREKNKQQINQIKDYITSGDAAFPNTIILGANLDANGYRIVNEDKNKWTLSDDKLYVPFGSFKASIIDGQHRILGFQKLLEEDSDHEVLDMELVCSLYLDLPLTYHAQIFTHINSTPRRVNRNLIYQLYQIDMDEKSPECWSAEVLAVYMAKALDSDESSPIRDRVKLSVKEKEILNDWNFTFAALVEGILPLLSTNPMRDKNTLSTITRGKSKNDKIVYAERNSLDGIEDIAPFRNLYLKQKDSTIYNEILKFIKVINKHLIQPKDTVFRKSVGLSACFMAYKELLLFSKCNSSEVIAQLDRNLCDLNLDEIPDIASTKLQGILKNTILFIVGPSLGYPTKSVKFNIKDKGLYQKLTRN